MNYILPPHFLTSHALFDYAKEAIRLNVRGIFIEAGDERGARAGFGCSGRAGAGTISNGTKQKACFLLEILVESY